MNQQQTLWQRYGIFFKSMIVGFLIIVLLIPTSLIKDVVFERQNRQTEVIAEVSSKWASAQTIKGPFLLIPYLEYKPNEHGKVLVYKRMLHYMPDVLEVSGILMPEVKKRSIFKIVLYKSEIVLKGKIAPLQLAKIGIDPNHIQWNEVRLCLGITDNRGIAESLVLFWNGKPTDMEPSLPETDIATSGASTLVTHAIGLKDAASTFQLKLKLNGSERLYFTPLAKQTSVQLQSSWADPTFDGKFLPHQSDVKQNGFIAKWNILHFTRDIPQVWKTGTHNVDGYAFGVGLLQGIDSYSKTMRSVKYSLLFIALTFCLFFFIEILKKRSVHPLQYILVGLAICIFYILLLSVSEHTGFNIAYVIASVATIGLISAYTYSIFKQLGVAIALTSFLSALYGFIYILIQMQDGALLFGSIGLFVLLAIVMFYSRKIDWYSETKTSSYTEKPVI